jgi:hypothetical protein
MESRLSSGDATRKLSSFGRTCSQRLFRSQTSDRCTGEPTVVRQQRCSRKRAILCELSARRVRLPRLWQRSACRKIRQIRC